VELTPAAERPWVAGTSDNSALSLIFGYNGLGRVDGQAGGPGGGGPGASSLFGGSPGPLRLLNSAIGGQAGWLLGFAIVAGLGMLAASRLRRSDPRTGWLVAVGGAFLTTAVLFSAASGIFHPYYVSLLAPFTAALVGAGAAQLGGAAINVRIFGPLALAAGAASELVVLGDYPGQLRWLEPLLLALAALAALALLVSTGSRVRIVATSTAIVALLIAPSVWALQTLGHAASGTFPAGGPASIRGGGPGGPMSRNFARMFGGAGRPFQLAAPGWPAGAPQGAPAAGQLGMPAGGPPGAAPGFAGAGPAGIPLGASSALAPRAPRARPAGLGESLSRVLSYIKRHGGGTLAVSSQSGAASSIIANNAAVAGIGGFSGRESEVSLGWLAREVRAGKIRWVLLDGLGANGGGGPRLPGDTRTGSRTALVAVASACRKVGLPAGTLTGARASSLARANASGTLYDCSGRAAALSG
jgi:hypothetical protein